MGQITIYRGSHQIGGCATEIKTEKHRIIIDFGANLPDTDDSAISDEELFDKVFDGRDCDAVLFTHYHGDHMGLFKRIPQGVPLFIGKTAKKIMEIHNERLDKSPRIIEKGLQIVQSMKCYSPAQKLAFGDISVTPFVVDHSAIDAYMFLIEADGKKILFTGDFREHGIVGQNNRLERMITKYRIAADILITEGTMLSRIDETKSNPLRTERDLRKRAAELFRENKQSVILVSSTNLDSIMEFYHALPDNMGFVCDAYQAKIMLAAMEDKGIFYPEYRHKIINGKNRMLSIIGELDGLSETQHCKCADTHELWSNGFTMLARERTPIFRRFYNKMRDPLVIYSKWSGYLYGKHQVPETVEFIGDHRMEKVHTSGHAYPETIEKVIRLTQPTIIIPMHTECAEGFSEMSEFAAYRNKIKVLRDGEQYFF